MKIEYAFEPAALPKLIILIKEKPNPGDKLVNPRKPADDTSLIVEKIEGDKIAVKPVGSGVTFFLACNVMTEAQWRARFA